MDRDPSEQIVRARGYPCCQEPDCGRPALPPDYIYCHPHGMGRGFFPDPDGVYDPDLEI